MTELPTERRDAVRSRLLTWQREHGRHDLPWQTPATPYRVWVSEIMLQQTRVETVIPFFQRFIHRCPDVNSLAAGSLDEVLALWAGLGYYARARNLHRAAAILASEAQGRIPSDLESLQTLPGVGPSTAGAIRSLGHGLPAPILDGNVKRVLARLEAVPGWPGRSPVQRQLWSISAQLAPESDECARFNQGLMDLGATVCTPTAPLCGGCPWQSLCHAYAEGTPEAYPGRRPRQHQPLRQVQVLLLESQGHVLLEKRPPTGVWGGLWSLPEADVDQSAQARALALGVECSRMADLPPYEHTFSHFKLRMFPVRLAVQKQVSTGAIGEAGDVCWFNPRDDGEGPGIAAPIRRIVEAALGGG